MTNSIANYEASNGDAVDIIENEDGTYTVRKTYIEDGKEGFLEPQKGLSAHGVIGYLTNSLHNAHHMIKANHEQATRFRNTISKLS